MRSRRRSMARQAIALLLLPLLVSACGGDRVPVTSGNNEVTVVQGSTAVTLVVLVLAGLLVWLLLRRRGG